MWKKILSNPIRSLTAATAFIVACTTLVSMLSNVALKLSQPAGHKHIYVDENGVEIERKRILIEMDARIDSLNNEREHFLADGAK